MGETAGGEEGVTRARMTRRWSALTIAVKEAVDVLWPSGVEHVTVHSQSQEKRKGNAYAVNHRTCERSWPHQRLVRGVAAYVEIFEPGGQDLFVGATSGGVPFDWRSISTASRFRTRTVPEYKLRVSQTPSSRQKLVAVLNGVASERVDDHFQCAGINQKELHAHNRGTVSERTGAGKGRHRGSAEQCHCARSRRPQAHQVDGESPDFRGAESFQESQNHKHAN